MMRSTVSAAYMRYLMSTGQALGVNGRQMLESEGTALPTLEDPDNSIPSEAMGKLWRALEGNIERTTLIRTAVITFGPPSLGVAGVVMSSCRNCLEVAAV